MERILVEMAGATLDIWLDTAFFLLMGFFLAGLINTFIRPEQVTRLLGRNSLRSVLLASLVGAPLPICSCGVLPTAIALRRQGASQGATVSFLIATPETGIDSISITYALMDGLMAIFRPVAALITAITAGIVTNILGGDDLGSTSHDGCEDDTGICGGNCDVHSSEFSSTRTDRFPIDLRGLFRFAFMELMDDISYWLMFSLVLAAGVTVLLPPDLFSTRLGSGLPSMLLMIIAGIPLYICATSMTPLAAALMVKGLNPGAALVFLLCGPATNITSLAMIGKFMGRRVLAIYLGSIIMVSLLLGVIVNRLYEILAIDPHASLGQAGEFIPGWLRIIAAVILAVIMLSSFIRQGPPASCRKFVNWLEHRLGRPVSNRVVVMVVALVVLILYLCSGIFTLEPGERGVVTRFGRIVHADLEPGLHIRLPAPFERHQLVSTTMIRRLEFTLGANDADESQRLMLSGDENLVDLSAAVHYRIEQPVQYLYKVESADLLIRHYAAAVIRQVIATLPIDAILASERATIEKTAESILQERLQVIDSGITITALLVQYAHAPREAHHAFRDVASAQEDHNTSLNLAELYRNRVVATARGEARKIGALSAATAAETTCMARGEGEAFMSRAGAYRESPTVTGHRLHHESLRVSLGWTDKVLVPPGTRISGSDIWLMDDFNAAEKTAQSSRSGS
ncbi:SO_0444 family Cu/Zn efflux transporter [bacterium]|nr:SO_0444 family Cu/Zn efflux transporter [candidate division CSSED10-310 bacterium]